MRTLCSQSSLHLLSNIVFTTAEVVYMVYKWFCAPETGLKFYPWISKLDVRNALSFVTASHNIHKL